MSTPGPHLRTPFIPSRGKDLGGVRLIDAVSTEGALVLADDLQWADATSLALLGLIARRISRLGMVLAYRPEEVSPDSPLAGFLAELPRLAGDPLVVPLGPLSHEAVIRLVSHEGLARTITQATDGTPFAVTEVVRALVAGRAVEWQPDGRWRPRSDKASGLALEAARAGQRRAIEARVKAQPSSGRQLLCLLALLGREAPSRLLAISGGFEPKKVLDELDALARAGLVRFAEAGWASAHDLIGETVAEGMARAERGRLHEMLAVGLGAVGSDPSELARHLAGAGDREKAAEALGEAARQRLARHASAEAEHLAEAGLALDPKPPVRSGLLEVRAEARARRGDLAGAREDLRAALAGQDRGAERSRLLARMAMMASGSEDLALAAELSELAISQAGNQPDARAEALFVGAIVDMNADRRARAQARFDEALALFERLGNARGIADILDGRAMAALLEGKLRPAAEAFDRVARLFMDSGELLRAVTPRASRGLALVWMGRPGEGLPDTDEALDLARTLGHPEGEAYALWCRSEALAAVGRTTEALESAGAALAIAERLGHGEWTATSLRGLGIARQAAADLEGAEGAFRQSLEVAEHHHLPHFESFAAARLASVLIGRGKLSEAEPMVARALATGLPLSLYEARLAQAQLAAARDDPGSQGLIAQALRSQKPESICQARRRSSSCSLLSLEPGRAWGDLDREGMAVSVGFRRGLSQALGSACHGEVGEEHVDGRLANRHLGDLRVLRPHLGRGGHGPPFGGALSSGGWVLSAAAQVES